MHLWSYSRACVWSMMTGPLPGGRVGREFILVEVNWNKKKHTHAHSHLSWSSVIPYLLPPSMASSLFNLHAWQSFSTISLQVFFGLPLELAPSISYSTNFFTQSLSSFRSTCPYHCNLFCCSTKIMSSNPSLRTLYLELYLVASCHISI